MQITHSDPKHTQANRYRWLQAPIFMALVMCLAVALILLTHRSIFDLFDPKHHGEVFGLGLLLLTSPVPALVLPSNLLPAKAVMRFLLVGMVWGIIWVISLVVWHFLAAISSGGYPIGLALRYALAMEYTNLNFVYELFTTSLITLIFGFISSWVVKRCFNSAA